MLRLNARNTPEQWQSLGPDAPGSFANNKQKVIWQNCGVFRGIYFGWSGGGPGTPKGHGKPLVSISNHAFKNETVTLAPFNRDTMGCCVCGTKMLFWLYNFTQEESEEKISWVECQKREFLWEYTTTTLIFGGIFKCDGQSSDSFDRGRFFWKGKCLWVHIKKKVGFFCIHAVLINNERLITDDFGD